MHKIIFGRRDLEDCIQRDMPWKCIYEKYREVFQNSIGKMLDIEASQIFNNAKSDNLENILKALREFEKRKKEIEKILVRAEDLCPIEEKFLVYFLPSPFDWVITQYSKNLGLFILFARGDGAMVKFSQFPIYLPHEYAHVVRLHSVLVPQGISSPYQMSFSNLGILEGLGVLFSAYFNNDLKKENIWKYIPIKPERWKEYMKKEYEYIEIFKNHGSEKLSKNEIQELYGPERVGYVMGSLVVFSLMKKGYSLCELDKMKDEEIINLL